MMRDDDNPPDVEIPRASSSLTPEAKLTLQQWLIALLAFDLTVALVSAIFRVDSQGLWSVINTVAGGALGALMGNHLMGRTR